LKRLAPMVCKQMNAWRHLWSIILESTVVNNLEKE